MTLLKNFKKRMAAGLSQNFSLVIYSIVIAVIAWFIIAMAVYPSISKTVANIPVSLDISNTSAAENGLSLISCDVESVEVKILGNRAEIGNITEEDLTARIVADNVTSTGTKTLSISIAGINDEVEFEVEDIVPDTATVVFDKYETREFQITPEIPGISLAAGKVVDNENYVCEPDVVTITGPSAQLDKINKCVAVSNKKFTIDSSYAIASDEIKLYSEDGTTLDQSSMKFNNTSFLINIPVLTQKTLDLSVGISGAPSNFDTSVLKFKLSADTITLASNASQTEFPQTFEVGKVRLSDLEPGYTTTFQITAEGFKNMSNLETVTVTLDDSELSKRDFTINEFNIVNPPDGYEFDVLTQSLNVSVVGPEDVINEITPSDIVADVNLLNTDQIPESGSFNWDVTISFPQYDNIWAVTRSKVIVSKTAKEKETTAPSQASTDN